MIKNFIITISLFILFSLNTAQAATGTNELLCYKIGYADAEKDIVRQYITPLSEVYGNIGACVDFVQLPYNRLMRMVKNNEIDAIMGRSYPAIENNPDLVYVPTPLINFKGYLVSRPTVADGIRQNRTNLHNYSLAGLYGSDWSMQALKDNNLDVEYVEDIDQLLEMYAHSRIDGFLAIEEYMPQIMQKLTMSESGSFQTMLLYDVPVYHILAPKNKDIIDRLDVSVKTVKAKYGINQEGYATAYNQ